VLAFDSRSTTRRVTFVAVDTVGRPCTAIPGVVLSARMVRNLVGTTRRLDAPFEPHYFLDTLGD
jgi:hypothetical protein